MVGILPYFPLAGGFLTGKYKRSIRAPAARGESSPYVQAYMTNANYDKLEKLEAWAAAREHTIGELAHAWLLAHPAVSSVISGATSADQLLTNAKSGRFGADCRRAGRGQHNSRSCAGRTVAAQSPAQCSVNDGSIAPDSVPS